MKLSVFSYITVISYIGFWLTSQVRNLRMWLGNGFSQQLSVCTWQADTTASCAQPVGHLYIFNALT
uniref:Uncharacterized protein n=1 Tax=Anguilla anguilla TaxID=7936 RepID=A0A0E9R760_ANGAN